jgi:hypothetical protein
VTAILAMECWPPRDGTEGTLYQAAIRRRLCGIMGSAIELRAGCGRAEQFGGQPGAPSANAHGIADRGPSHFLSLRTRANIAFVSRPGCSRRNRALVAPIPHYALPDLVETWRCSIPRRTQHCGRSSSGAPVWPVRKIGGQKCEVLLAPYLEKPEILRKLLAFSGRSVS